MSSTTSGSRRGIQRERAVRDVLLDDDWVVVRAAGSLGCVDLVALKAGHRPRLIEVKSTHRGPYHGFGPADRADISVRALWAGADAFLAFWPPRGKLQWIPESEWPAPRSVTERPPEHVFEEFRKLHGLPSPLLGDEEAK